MTKWRVRYTGPQVIEIEADSQNEAENYAEDAYGYDWRADEICEEEENG